MNPDLMMQKLTADTMSAIGQRPSKPELHAHGDIDAEAKNQIR